MSSSSENLEVSIEYHTEVITRLTDTLHDVDPDDERTARRFAGGHCPS